MLKNLLGDPNARKLKKYKNDIVEVNLLEQEIQVLSDEQLTQLPQEFSRLAAVRGNVADESMPGR